MGRPAVPRTGGAGCRTPIGITRPGHNPPRRRIRSCPGRRPMQGETASKRDPMAIVNGVVTAGMPRRPGSHRPCPPRRGGRRWSWSGRRADRLRAERIPEAARPASGSAERRRRAAAGADGDEAGGERREQGHEAGDAPGAARRPGGRSGPRPRPRRPAPPQARRRRRRGSPRGRPRWRPRRSARRGSPARPRRVRTTSASSACQPISASSISILTWRRRTGSPRRRAARRPR